jgi:2',3'-cyclic-nucleotide 2'-phosphodiesterase (5'-nucleotidase family)
MPQLVLLHTNDIHGRTAALARIATLVRQIRAEEPGAVVVWLDAGDVEDTTNELSNVTKGTAMLRLLGVAGCDVAAVGNASILRYGPEVLAEQADAATFPLLAANLRDGNGELLGGARASTLLHRGELALGVIGVTAVEWFDGRSLYDSVFGTTSLAARPLVGELARDLRQRGADVVVLLSHLGLEADHELVRDGNLDVDVIVGGHSHDLLPEGELHDDTLLAHAGEFGQFLGRVDIDLDARTAVARVLPVTDDVALDERVLARETALEHEVAAYLDVVVGHLARPFDWATDRECAMGSLMADVMRERMSADVAVAVAGSAFVGPLPAGPLSRGALYRACPSPGNPGVAALTGAQLAELVARGLDPERATATPRPLRGVPQGLMHLSGAIVVDGSVLVDGQPLDPERTYRVAGSDWELDTYGGYTDPAWHLEVDYDVPTILREAVETYLAGIDRPLEPASPRLG